MRKNKVYGFLILLAGVFWGSSCLFVSWLSEHTPASSVQLTAVRIVFAAVVLNGWMILKNRGFSAYKLTAKSWLTAACTGLGSILAMGVFHFRCLMETSAAVAVILLYTSPVFVMILSFFLFKEKITARKITAFLAAILGCALVSGIASGAQIRLAGMIFGLLSGLSYSLYGIFTAIFMRKNKDSLVFAALSFLFAALGALVLSKPWEIVSFTAESEQAWLLLVMYVLLAVCTAVIPFFLYTKGMEAVSPAAASILAFTEPLSACVFGTVVLGQKMDVYGVLGIVCVCAAIVILQASPRTDGENAPTAEK